MSISDLSVGIWWPALAIEAQIASDTALTLKAVLIQGTSVARWGSSLDALQKSNALDGEVPILLDKVVLHAAHFGSSKDPGPVEIVLSDSDTGTAYSAATTRRRHCYRVKIYS